MKRILVPVDFSEYSMNAIEVASYIAKVKDLSIRLLHVVEDTYTPYYNMAGMNMIEDNTLITYRQELEETVKEKLEGIAQKLRGKNLSVEYDTILDTPHKAILNDARKDTVELVVMGSHGHSDIEEIFLGGTTERVIRHSNKPVLSVHKLKENYKINRIVFASNFEEKEIENVLQRVIHLAEIFMAELFLVRINAPSKSLSETESRNKVKELSEKFNLSIGAVTIYSDKTEEEGIVNFAKEIDANLITMVTHGRTGLARLFKGSIAEEVAGFSTIPVITYNLSSEKPKTSATKRSEKRIRIDHAKKINK